MTNGKDLMNNLIDTHCHIHDEEFFDEAAAKLALERAVNLGVKTVICVATTLEDSRRAIGFTQSNPDHCLSTVGIHPHEAAKLSLQQIDSQLSELSSLADSKSVVGVGECGFDFYYNDRKVLLQSHLYLIIIQTYQHIQN